MGITIKDNPPRCHGGLKQIRFADVLSGLARGLEDAVDRRGERRVEIGI